VLLHEVYTTLIYTLHYTLLCFTTVLHCNDLKYTIIHCTDIHCGSSSAVYRTECYTGLCYCVLCLWHVLCLLYTVDTTADTVITTSTNFGFAYYQCSHHYTDCADLQCNSHSTVNCAVVYCSAACSVLC
jgi:hypothetical protein